MKIPFVKYHGTGNDFILIDETESDFHLTEQQVKRMCDRHFGIGADGLICLRTSSIADFEMIYYNSDGRLGSMCGNGGRCAVLFANELKMIGDETTFIAADGSHKASISFLSDREVKLKMNDVDKIEKQGNDYFVNTGSPHFIRLVSNLAEAEVDRLGREVRNWPSFIDEGTNVNFVLVNGSILHIRTYERGVEAETLSCGTGVVGSVLALVHAGLLSAVSPAQVQSQGGRLKVHFRQEATGFKDIYLEGSAVAVFQGLY